MKKEVAGIAACVVTILLLTYAIVIRQMGYEDSDFRIHTDAVMYVICSCFFGGFRGGRQC